MERKDLSKECFPDGEGGYIHKECGSTIMSKTLRLSVMNDIFNSSLVGTGEVVTKTIPYCPVCDLSDDEHGTTSTSLIDKNERAIIKRIAGES